MFGLCAGPFDDGKLEEKRTFPWRKNTSMVTTLLANAELLILALQAQKSGFVEISVVVDEENDELVKELEVRYHHYAHRRLRKDRK